jgi:predicted DNA-binding protein
MSRDITPFGLRMPAELKARVDAAATKSGRSINAEVVARLQESFEASAAVDVNALAEALAPKLAEQVAAKLKETPTS